MAMEKRNVVEPVRTPEHEQGPDMIKDAADTFEPVKEEKHGSTKPIAGE